MIQFIIKFKTDQQNSSNRKMLGMQSLLENL